MVVAAAGSVCPSERFGFWGDLCRSKQNLPSARAPNRAFAGVPQDFCKRIYRGDCHNSGVMGREIARTDYRCVATSIEGFVQQLAVSYLRHGYWFYVTGRIPPTKDPCAVDEKLITQYQIDISKWARARRKRAGFANLHYLRHERFFVLCATHGRHRFFEEESNLIRDARRVPVKFAGYAISHRDGHPHVRVEREQYKLLKAYLLELATRRKKETLEREFFRLPFEPYAPVRQQLLMILRAVNTARRKAGYELLSANCLRFKREIVRPFEAVDQNKEEQLSGSEGNRIVTLPAKVGHALRIRSQP
jgi:hypothetical protein